MKPISEITISPKTEARILYAVLVLGGIAIGVFLAAAYIANGVVTK